MGLRSHFGAVGWQAWFLLAVAACVVLMALSGCDDDLIPTITADAGKPKPVEKLADDAIKTGRNLSAIGQTISTQTQAIRNDVQPSPPIAAAVGSRLSVIDTAVAALNAIAQTQQTQTVAELRAVVADLKSVIAERDAAITEFKRLAKAQEKLAEALKEARQREATAIKRATDAEARENQAWKRELRNKATLGAMGGMGLFALAGWLAFTGKFKEAAGAAALGGLALGLSALLVWFAEHYREIGIGFGALVVCGCWYVVRLRRKLDHTETTVETLVPIIDEADPTKTMLKPKIAERAKVLRASTMVEDTVTAAKRRVRRATEKLMAAGAVHG